MARVQLHLKPTDPPHEYRVRRPGGPMAAIPGLRLGVYVRLVGQVNPGRDAARVAFPDCVFDTGSFLSIVPFRIRRHLRPGVVTFLPFDQSIPPPLRVVTIAGGTFPYDLGEITLSLHDPFGGQLDATVVAKFTRDGGALTVPLTLGLRGGAIDGRILRAEADPTAPFGQAWVLEDTPGSP
ncbi:MAG: hypothetical protein JWO38_101 [Gemmataceae bacterium]|nr:hypothetical protein [Gemmataceae bacterium]